MDHAPLDAVDAIARRIRPVVESDCRVRFVYLCGSRARGDARPGSDVDLAVSLRPSGSLLDDARLHDQLAAALDRDDVDLLIVDSAPLWLQFRVVSGRVLFAMLTRYVRILRDLADMPLAEYQADPRNFGSGERFLQLAIETALSVGHHIIASAGFDQPTSACPPL